MKKKDQLHTTNYSDTFIEVAEDYPDTVARAPQPGDGKRTVAQQQYELLAGNPYQYTSDDVLFRVYAERMQLAASEYEKKRTAFFSKGQACFRASPLTKRHGFGVHADENGKIALYPLESDEYQSFLKDPKVKKVKAMRTSKK